LAAENVIKYPALFHNIFPPGKQILQKKVSNILSDLNIAFVNIFYTLP